MGGGATSPPFPTVRNRMPKMRDLEKVGADYAKTGPNQIDLRQPIEVPATTLFSCLADGPAWKEWLGIEVEWTSAEPHKEGTTRTVTTKGQTIEEYFLTWDTGERMIFRFDRCTLPVNAFAEHYECIPTSDTTCELVWSYAYEWGGPLEPVIGKAFDTIFAFNGRRALAKLAALLESNPQRWT